GDQYAETEGLINWGEGVELQGPLDFPRQMYTTALVIAEEINNLRLTARCLKCLGRVAWREGDIAAAESYYERSMEIEQRRGDQIAEGQILVRLGLNAEYEGHIDRALAFFQKAEEIYRRVSHSYRLAGVFLNLGHVHFIMDNYENAKELNQRALEIFQDTNDRHNEAAVRQALGIVQLYETDLAAARQSFSVGLSLSQDILDRRNSSRAYYGLGLVDHYEGNYISAEENFNHALTISIEIDDLMTTGLVNRALGLNCWMVGQYQAAEEYLTRALKGQSSMMDQAHSLADMVLVLGSQKKFAEALDTAEKGLALAGELGQRLVRGILYCRTGNIYLSLLENDKAKEYFLKGLAIFKDVNAKHFSAEANAGLAYLHLVEGEHGLALEWVNGLLKDFPGGRVPGIHSPLWLMGLAYQILKLHIDPRQETVWETLRIGVSDLAGQTGGETARKNIAARLSAYNMAGILEVPWENLILERIRV
ncbi:MAG: tetratricopeptide repeat protein, partial [Anaerolineae bacterium]|nr:tetratricopeptide repeat protein [Anaerolineae bacterium]